MFQTKCRPQRPVEMAFLSFLGFLGSSGLCNSVPFHSFRRGIMQISPLLDKWTVCLPVPVARRQIISTARRQSL